MDEAKIDSCHIRITTDNFKGTQLKIFTAWITFIMTYWNYERLHAS